MAQDKKRWQVRRTKKKSATKLVNVDAPGMTKSIKFAFGPLFNNRV